MLVYPVRLSAAMLFKRAVQCNFCTYVYLKSSLRPPPPRSFSSPQPRSNPPPSPPSEPPGRMGPLCGILNRHRPHLDTSPALLFDAFVPSLCGDPREGSFGRVGTRDQGVVVSEGLREGKGGSVGARRRRARHMPTQLPRLSAANCSGASRRQVGRVCAIHPLHCAEKCGCGGVRLCFFSFEKCGKVLEHVCVALPPKAVAC